MRSLYALILSFYLLVPLAAASWIEVAKAKDPLEYSLRQYAFVFGVALAGGLVSWFNKLRKGEVNQWSVSSLVGELTTSAFAGVLCFWVCEFSSVQPLLTAALTGLAGHAGARTITLLEEWGMKRAQKLAGPTQ